jgi:NAD(P)H-flavin reductase
MIQQHFAAPGADTMVLSCGPKPMTDAMKGYLDSMGYSEDSQFQF